ncbi:DUF6191 domain-containing protein [Streptomyces sp. NPDC052042]|uniref:DUF6191 domain-containing protein n=1 Tax=Streptomyces sp. NPDC052042 TaxID=3365683 RepID=UPI0037CD222D
MRPVFNFFEELFAPGRRHVAEERKRLELTRVDLGVGDPGRGPIDLTSGKVVVRAPGASGTPRIPGDEGTPEDEGTSGDDGTPKENGASGGDGAPRDGDPSAGRVPGAQRARGTAAEAVRGRESESAAHVPSEGMSETGPAPQP